MAIRHHVIIWIHSLSRKEMGDIKGGENMQKLSQFSPRDLEVVERILNGVEGAIIIDENGIIRVFTDFYEKESGLVKEQVLGKRVDQVFPHTRM